jgi:hypothetical protein
MLCRGTAGLLSLVDALLPCCCVVVFGVCFATVLQFRWILGRRGLFSSRYFDAVVISAPLANALPLRMRSSPSGYFAAAAVGSSLHRLCGFTTLLSTNALFSSCIRLSRLGS